jgi:hypothetical protein
VTDSPDVDSWQNLKSQLLFARDSIKPQGDQWRYQPNLDVSYEDSQLLWEKEVDRFSVPVTYGVVAWLRTNSLEEPNPQIRYFLSARFAAAFDFVESLLFVKDGKWNCLLPFPDSNLQDLLLSLLTDWWDGIGQFRFFEKIHAGKMLS